MEASVEGYNTCVMCYGQTGSGKTHTVMGSLASGGMQVRSMDTITDHQNPYP